MVGEAAVEETEQVQFYQLEITHICRQFYLIGLMKFLTALLEFVSFLSFLFSTHKPLKQSEEKIVKVIKQHVPNGVYTALQPVLLSPTSCPLRFLSPFASKEKGKRIQGRGR